MYFFACSEKSLRIYLKEIKLANEAIKVPIAPTLTPCSKYLDIDESVNVDRRTAVGTFDINWDAIIPVKYTLILPSRKFDNTKPIFSILLRLPVIIKNEINVSNKYQSTRLNKCLAKIKPRTIVIMNVYNKGIILNIEKSALRRIKL